MHILISQFLDAIAFINVIHNGAGTQCSYWSLLLISQNTLISNYFDVHNRIGVSGDKAQSRLTCAQQRITRRACIQLFLSFFLFCLFEKSLFNKLLSNPSHRSSRIVKYVCRKRVKIMGKAARN